MGKVRRETQADKPIPVMTGREFARRVKVIADRRGLTMAETLDRFAWEGITNEYKRCLTEMNESLAHDPELGGEG